MKYWEYRTNSLRFINTVYIVVLTGIILLYRGFFSDVSTIFFLVALVFAHILFLILVFSFVKKFEKYFKYLLCFCIWTCTIFITVYLYLIDLDAFSYMHVIFLIISLFSVFNKKVLFIVCSIYLLIVIPAMVISPINADYKYIIGLSIFIIFILFLIKNAYDDKISKANEESINAHKGLLDNAQEAFVLFESLKNENDEICNFLVTSINKAFVEITGVEEKNVLGKSITSLMPDIEDYWIDTLANVMEKKEAITFTRYLSRIEKHIKVSVYPVSEKMFAALFSDVTSVLLNERNLKLAIKRSEDTDKLKNQFLKDINHRLRTPLNGIMGMLQLISTDDLSQDDKQLFDAMSIEVFHIRNIINQISKYVDMQSHNFEYEKMCIKNLIFNEIENYKKENFEIIVNEPMCCKNEEFYIQKELFEIVFKELLKNAAKHTRNKKIEIKISCENEVDEEFTSLKVEVIDFGTGIESEKLLYIFNEFYHHDFINIYKDEKDYSIPICKQMLLNNSGDLLVESTFGQGTNFKIILAMFSI